MFKTIKNALKTPEVRKKLLYTLLLIVIFRLGCYITIPGVDSVTVSDQMKAASNGVTGLIDTISGGAFSRLSIFAMSITPYITASIVIQLLGMVIPSLERLVKEGGEEGKTKVNKYTKILTVILALIEGLGVFFSYKSTGIFLDTGFLGGFLTVLSLMTGTALLIWLGEQITNKGIGNGISMLIFVGIIAGLPKGITQEEYLNGQVSVLRNPIVASVFFRLNIIESFGTGVQRMNMAYAESRAKPRHEFSTHAIKVVLPVVSGGEELSEDEAMIYNSMNRLGKSSSQIAKAVGFGKNKTLKLLVALEEKGYVTKLGNGRGIKYLIKS